MAYLSKSVRNYFFLQNPTYRHCFKCQIRRIKLRLDDETISELCTVPKCRCPCRLNKKSQLDVQTGLKLSHAEIRKIAEYSAANGLLTNTLSNVSVPEKITEKLKNSKGSKTKKNESSKDKR